MSTIQNIQFKRGTKSALELNLKESALGVLKAGEPAFEIDTGSLKIGDGITDYTELPYIGNGGGEDDRFVIHDPVQNQVLLYDDTLGKWVNKALVDESSIIYDNGLSLKGYAEAKQGQMLVKDNTAGIAWINPLSTEQLDTAVANATASAQLAGTYATYAGNSARDASLFADQAERINQQTMKFVNNKFWWGTLAEYNALETITEGTIYCIQI